MLLNFLFYLVMNIKFNVFVVMNMIVLLIDIYFNEDFVVFFLKLLDI